MNTIIVPKCGLQHVCGFPSALARAHSKAVSDERELLEIRKCMSRIMREIETRDQTLQDLRDLSEVIFYGGLE